MKRRRCCLVLIALVAGTSGCAGTARRGEGGPLFGSTAWNEPPAPPQRPVSLAAARAEPVVEPAARPEGLAKYFPSLRRPAPETPRLAASKVHPTWFGTRSPKAVGSRTYMTDAREQLNRPGPEPTSLPVALQVPIERASSDKLVTPAHAEAPEVDRPPSADVPDFGGKPSRPGEDEVNPLPPASEPAKPAEVAQRMPEVPAVDPLEARKPDKPAAEAAPSGEAAPDEGAVKASADAAEETPPADPAPKPKQPTTQVAEASKAAPSPPVVLASPQGPPPKSHVHVNPTSQARPTPQGGAQAAGEAKTWKRPCLRRLVRRVGKMGEFADPPTAAPH